MWRRSQERYMYLNVLCFRSAMLRYIHFDVDITTPWETPDGVSTNRNDALPA